MTFIISINEHSHDPQAAGAPFTVKQVQSRLQTRGYNIGQYGVDGKFGPDCDAATRRYQKMNGLYVDGRVGPDTWKKLAVSTTTASSTTAPTSAKAFADHAYKLVTNGIDGSRPAYVFGAEANLKDASPDKIDCSELVQWAVYQQTHDSWVDGSRYQYAACKHISVDQALHTKGALLFVTNSGSPNGIHHVAVSMGNGTTAEARSKYAVAGELSSGKAQTVGSWKAAGRFQYGGLVPVLRY